MDFRRMLTDWQARNRQSNGTLLLNTAVTVAVLIVTVLTAVIGIVLTKHYVTKAPTPAPVNLTVDVAPKADSSQPQRLNTDSGLVSGTPYYSDPKRQAADNQISVAVYAGCHTNSGRYQLIIEGLTPGGMYTVQTDWSDKGRFGYGDGAYADYAGKGFYSWSCYDATGVLMTKGLYDVLVTDYKTGFSRRIELRVG